VTPQFSLPPPKPHDAFAVLYFGASHVMGGIYLLPEGDEYCCADGSLYGQDAIDQYHDIYTCWRCGGLGLLKVYLSRGYELAQCEECRGSCQSGLMPDLRPRHVHDWQPSDDKVPARFDPQRCSCGARWLKKRERAAEPKSLAGLTPLAALLKGGQPCLTRGHAC